MTSCILFQYQNNQTFSWYFNKKRLPMPYVSYVTFTKMMKSKHKIPTFEALLKVTLETIEQLLMLPKVNTKHKRTTSWFLIQLSELNIFWMIVSTLLLSLSTLHCCVLVCTGMHCSASKRISIVAKRIRENCPPHLCLSTLE